MVKSFASVLTPFSVAGDLPLEVIPGYFFDRPDELQLKKLQEQIVHFHPKRLLWSVPYQEDLSDFKIPTHLTSEQWKYWIITFDWDERSDEYLYLLQMAGSLLKDSLDLGFTVIKSNSPSTDSGYETCTVRLSRFPQMITYFMNCRRYVEDALNGISPYRVPRLSASDLHEMAMSFALIKSLDDSRPHILSAFTFYEHLKCVSTDSPLFLLGLFVTIELLITHAPGPKDPTDSLTRQIKTKMTLLHKRFERPLEYPASLKEANEEKAWTRLYGIRSLIAHTGWFPSDLSTMKDRDEVREFLEEVVKLLLLLTLKEPILITDLKNC